MKKLILLYFFVAIPSIIYSQDTLYVRGYYIERYLKSDLEPEIVIGEPSGNAQSKDNIAMEQFYFPLQINSRQPLAAKESIAMVFQANPDYKNTDIFQFSPVGVIEDSFRSLKLPMDGIIFPPVATESYYILEGDSSHLYKIYYIEGSTLRVEVENDYLNPDRTSYLIEKWGIAPLTVNLSIPSFYVYVFYKCDMIQSALPLEGFTKVSCLK